MAIGTTAAIIGSAAIGAGASAISAKQQSTANNRALNAQQQSSDEALAFQRDAFNTQTRLAEPFRQFGIQQANAMGELFGFNPVGQGGLGQGAPGGVGGMGGGNALDAYYASNPDVAREFSRVSGGGFGPNLPASYDQDGNGQVGREEFARFRADRFDNNEPGRNNPFNANPVGAMQARGNAMSNPGAVQGAPMGADGQPAADPNAINAEAQERSFERFDNSIYNRALQGVLGRAATGVDANFAASGNVYSGAREQAQQNTAADFGMNALGMYTNAMLGQPSTAGAQMGANAAGAFGANSANLALGRGQNAANSAYARGQNASGLTNNLANLAQFGLGAFSGGGGGSSPGFNGFAGGTLGSSVGNSPMFFG